MDSQIDWINGRIDKNKVMIVRFDQMMSNFDDLMEKIISFTEHNASNELKEDIVKVAHSQREYKSKHQYNLEKFGLTKERIKTDCKDIYETFLK